MQMQLKANLLYINFLTEGELQQYLGIAIFNFFVKLDNSTCVFDEVFEELRAFSDISCYLLNYEYSLFPRRWSEDYCIIYSHNFFEHDKMKIVIFGPF